MSVHTRQYVVNRQKFVQLANPVLLASPVLRFGFGYLVHAGVPYNATGVSYEGMCQTEYVKCWWLAETEFAAYLTGRTTL